MSIKSKLLEKTGDLLSAAAKTPATPAATAPSPAPSVAGAPTPSELHKPASQGEEAAGVTAKPSAPIFPGVVPGAGARTAPGQMLQFRGELQAKEQEVERLRQELEVHRGALPTRHLDPLTIGDSAWANRHDAAFHSAAFEGLKRDIQACGGNVQPIRVRPAHRGDGVDYEVVFGHRRLRACRELGLPVLAMIDNDVQDDLTLFALMDRENRERADLSAFEQGQAYKRALDAGLFPSRRRLAEALEVSHTWVSNVLAVAELPQAIIDCFASPLEIQHRHAKLLGDALARDSRGVLKRAERLRQLPNRLSASAVVTSLVGSEAKPAAPVVQAFKVGGRVLGKFTVKDDGSVLFELTPAAMDVDRRDQVLQALEAYLDKAMPR